MPTWDANRASAVPIFKLRHYQQLEAIGITVYGTRHHTEPISSLLRAALEAAR